MFKKIFFIIFILYTFSFSTMWQPGILVGYPDDISGCSFNSDNTMMYCDVNHGFYGRDIYMYQWNGNNWLGLGWLPGDVNTTEDELEPFVTYDGLHIYFQRWVPGPHYEIFVADWDGSGFYNSRQLIINTGDERFPSVTQDGQKLYFSRGKIWESTWTGSDWGTPVLLPPEVNEGGGYFRDHVTISPDSNELYFTGAGSYIYRLAYSVKVGGIWQQWQYCDYNINPPGQYNDITSPALTYAPYSTQRLYYERGVSTNAHAYYSLRSPLAVEPASLGQIKANYAK